jgi:endonuclease/exonuclease/phosphatase family metal-dependent hydrolase
MRLCTFNVENLFLSTTSVHQPLKNVDKVKWLARVIRDIDADVIFLVEVGGKISLEKFNSDYLDNNYHSSLIEGNSSRGIELGYLIHKRLSYRCEHLTHRNRPLNFIYPHHQKENENLVKQGKQIRYQSELMSRDIAELRLLDENDNLVCILLGLHLKSKLDDTGVDFNGNKRRASEMKLVLESYKKLDQRYHGKVPIFITGDFNGHANITNTEEAFQAIYKQTNLLDISEHLNWDESERTTFVIYDKNKKAVPLQLDYFFLDKKWAHLLNKEECAVYRYQKENVLPLPQTPFARAELPSDHYPLVVDISL